MSRSASSVASSFEDDDVENLLATTGTNTNPFSQIGIINKEKKKKPYDVKIKNNNPNEPKIFPNMKYSDKQKYRRYKTKTEPKLFNKIMIDEEDDVVNTIKKAFGIENKKNTNMTNIDPSEAPYYEEPNPVEVEQEPLEYINQPAPQQRQRQRQQQPQQPQPRENQPMATEITGDIASPPPVSPGRLIAIMALKVTAERRERMANEQAVAKERLLMLSKEAEEKRDKLLRAPLTDENEKKITSTFK